jgi:cytochrome c-type biogenesis protein CcmF
MEYVGEHLLPGILGRLFVNLAMVAALLSAVAYIIWYKNHEKGYLKVARAAFVTHAISVIGIAATLFYLLLSHYFEYDYVWKHSSLELPFKYTFSAFWEGQEGSFILWMVWNAILGLILMRTSKKLEAGAMAVFAMVQAFLASMILGKFLGSIKIGSSPFVLMRNTADNIGLPWTEAADYLQKFPAFMDGTGLNPLLQNYWMTIHPPTLFLGFASTLPVFAFAMAALFSKQYTAWVKTALPWAFFSVGILGLGILMGGAWAYEALSFGGFWAWDPVENSSLVPWITMVAAAHLLLIYHNRKTGLSSAFFMVILTFLLILYSTFLTRSGVLGDTSVHSFVGLGLAGQLLIYLLFFVVVAVVLFFIRKKHFPKEKNEDNLSSREFWMFIGSLVLLIAAFQIIFTTSIPVVNQVFGPDGFLPLHVILPYNWYEENLAPPIDVLDHYNGFQVPFALFISLLMAVAQFLNYRKTDTKRFWNSIFISLAISLIITSFLAQYYSFWKDGLHFVLLFTSLFAACSNLDYWLRLRKGNWQFSGSSIAHLGFALILAGALISNAKKKIVSNTQFFLSEDLPSRENALLELGDTTRLASYYAVFEQMREGENQKQFYDVSYFTLNEDSSFTKEFSLEPFLQMSDNMGPTPNPSTKHYWDRDLYTHVTYSSYLEPASPDGYGKEMEVKLSRGDTAIYRQHFVIVDSLEVDALADSATGDLRVIKLTANLSVVNVMGERFEAKPSFILEDDIESYEDAYLDPQKFKFRFESVDTETNKIVLKAYEEVGEEKPFIVLKAILFPLINLLWIGCILMVIGSAIAVVQRYRKRTA